MVVAVDSAISLELISVAGATLVALIGGIITYFQARAMSKRARANGSNGMTAELWAEVREQLREARTDNTRLETELSVCHARVMVLTDELHQARRDDP